MTIRPSKILRVSGQLQRREWTERRRVAVARLQQAETINCPVMVNIALLVAQSCKSGNGHGFLLKCDPSPMPPLQWLWLAGDGFAA